MAKRKKGYLPPGTRVKIAANVGIRDDDGEVQTAELKGTEAEVSATNANYMHADTGEHMVGLTTPSGAIIAAPRAALRRQGGKKFFFFG